MACIAESGKKIAKEHQDGKCFWIEDKAKQAACIGDFSKTWFLSVSVQDKGLFGKLKKPSWARAGSNEEMKSLLERDPYEYVLRLSGITPDFEAMVQCGGIVPFLGMVNSMCLGMPNANMVEVSFMDRSHMAMCVYSSASQAESFLARPFLKLNFHQFVELAQDSPSGKKARSLPWPSAYQMRKFSIALSALSEMLPRRSLSMPCPSQFNGCSSKLKPSFLKLGLCSMESGEGGILVAEGSLHPGPNKPMFGKAKLAIAPVEFDGS